MTDHSSIEQAAALFLMRSQQPNWSNAEQRELDLWLERSMAHKAAFWRLQDGQIRVDRHLASALSHDESHNGTDDWRSGISSVLARSVRSIARPAFLVASCTVIFIAAHFALTPSRPQPEYTQHMTRLGQIGKLALADGSQVELNTDSGVRVAQSLGERTLWLERGEAYFEVAKDPERPFVVHVGSRRVTVLGTKFVVRRSGDDVMVGVVEGRVRVARAATTSEGSTTLTAGEIATTRGQSILVTADKLVQIRKGLSWRFSMLAFDDISLREAAAQFNRYNPRRLTIEDAEAGNLRISGSFRIGNVDGFVSLLEQAYGLRASRFENRIEINSR